MKKSMKKESAWIPVKDRLPKKDGEYRVTVQYYNVNNLSEKAGKPKLDIVEFYNGRWRTAKFRKVTAWMENPKPYEED